MKVVGKTKGIKKDAPDTVNPAEQERTDPYLCVKPDPAPVFSIAITAGESTEFYYEGGYRDCRAKVIGMTEVLFNTGETKFEIMIEKKEGN